MEVKYHKDYRHNFLILKSMQTSASSYQSRMMTDNEINGFLPCKERHINGEQLFYYEITSKQSLASLYECGGIRMELLCRLFVQLKTTWDAMSGFLLEEKYLVLRPEFIFMDVETKEFSFLYYPEAPEDDYITQLLEFLTEKVDSEDDRAVDAVYKMLELVEKEQFVIDEIIQWFEQDYDKGVAKRDEMPEIYVTYTGEEEPDFEEDIQHSVTGSSPRYLIINMAASFVAASGCIFVYFQFKLGKGESVCLCIALMAALAVFSFCGVQLFCRKFLPRQNLSGKNMENESRMRETYMYPATMAEEILQGGSAYGNTVYIPWTESCENKLYGMGKENKNHIDLNHLPVTVGKLAGSVDMVINEQSISRRHVKFARVNGRICMTDLNSTNGTFKNGMRLLPNTSEILEPGDEIRLGKLKFIYR